METTVTLRKRHFKAAAAKARALGMTPQAYIESLIDAAGMTFDEILAPVREDFRKSGMSEDELDDLVTTARKSIHRKSQRNKSK